MNDNFFPTSPTETLQTKGERTAARILQSAERLFAEQGYAGTSLRQIARGAGIREPGLYNHFAGKQELYDAVLKRALMPLTRAISVRLDEATGLPDYTELPSLLTDLLVQHPQRAALLQQALGGNGDAATTARYREWLGTVFERGVSGIGNLGLGQDMDRQTLVLNLVAILNLTAGYVLAADQIRLMGGGDVAAADNVARQKALLHKVIRAMLIN